MGFTISKETKNNGVLSIKPISKNEAKNICIKNHYSKKWNSSFGVYNFGIYQNNNFDECLGVAVFGNLMNPNSYKNIANSIERENVTELNRLWIDDCLVRNAETVFLSLCFKYFKTYIPKVKIIQSFADGRLGCGTIYKASNFKYFGSSKTLFFENTKTGEVRHKVPLENTKRLPRMMLENLKYIQGQYKPFYVNTYKYIYILDKKLKNKLLLKEEKYPEYSIGLEYIDKYEHSIGSLIRVKYAFEKLGYGRVTESFKEYLNKNYKYVNEDDYVNDSLLDYFSSDEKIKNLKDSFEKMLQEYKNELQNT